jgi:sugar/nucleoside kinase (ribokinase family)
MLCSGNIVFDLLVHPVDQLRWGTSTWVETIRQSMGGNGANTSYALARLGVPTRLVSEAGRDSFGDCIVAQLEHAGVDTGWVRRPPGATAITIVLVRSDGDRLLLHKPGVNADAFAAPLEFTSRITGDAAHYHLANPFAFPAFRAHAAETLRRARAAGLTTSLDAAWDSKGRWLEDLGPCLPSLDILFVNEEEARMLSGCEDPIEGGKQLRSGGAGTVVVKLGARGCSVLTAAGEIRVPGYVVEAADTTGAGDCFAGGYLAAWLRGFEPAEAARVANAAGALSVQRVGAVAGLLGWEETLAWMQSAVIGSRPQN